jgi:hypothetical protein
MTALTSGSYQGCPIKYLPTGYIVWLINQGHMKSRWWDFYQELEERIRRKSEPELPVDIIESTWFTGWEPEIQQRYASMMTDGIFDWTGKTRRGQTQLHELAVVFDRLSKVYA